ncbi:MAG: hypothetical protein ABI147_08775 [Acidobacteriaceae bacterium]
MRLLSKSSTVILLLAVCCCLRSQEPTSTTIQVQVLNAKTGRRVAHEGVNVDFKGVRGVPAFQTDALGIATVAVKSGDRVWVATNWWVTCRDMHTGEADYIPVERILQEGFVVNNTCGKARTESMRGRITIFCSKENPY